MLKVYNKLLKEFGKQHWWPVTNKTEDQRSSSDSRFEICVGAILTQNTNWQNVEKAIDNLIKNRMLTKEAIKNANISKLSALIRSSGYYKQKARKLKIFAGFDGEITRENLLSLWGIGPETADSIILYSAEKPIFVIDAYTKRIFSRLGFCNENCKYDELQDLFMKNLKHDVNLFKNYHAVLVEHAKNSCRKKPVCETCILRKQCKYYSSQKANYPSKNSFFFGCF